MISRNWEIVSKRVRSGRSWIQLGLVGKKDKVVYILYILTGRLRLVIRNPIA